jgi:hypothetical protein
VDTAILGRRVFGAVDPQVARWFASLAASAATSVRRPAVTSTSFAIEVATDRLAVPASLRGLESRDSPLGLRHVAIDDDEFWVLDPAAPGEQGVHGRFVEDGAQLVAVGDPFRAWDALRQALHEVLAASGVVWIHAAVAQAGAATVAFLGPSGRGKSTTLLRAVAAGWRPVAEDAAFVDVDSLTIVGADDRDHVRLRPTYAETGVPLPSAATPTPGADGRFEVAFADLGGRVPSARLTHLARLVRGTTAAPAWRALSRAEAVMALHEAVGVPTTRHVGRVLGPAFGDLVARVHPLTLDVGAPATPLPALPHG